MISWIGLTRKPDKLRCIACKEAAAAAANQSADVLKRLIQFIQDFLSFAGSLNPDHACFVEKPITQPPEIVALLAIGRLQWFRYRASYLPNQISCAVPEMIPELVELIVDYGMPPARASGL